jgi:ABC-type glycerol-3-phosphate transport system permease component
MSATTAGRVAAPAHATVRSRARRLRERAGRALLHLALLAAGLTFVAPLFWVVSTSLKPGSEVFTYPIHWIPSQPLWSNYLDIFGLIQIGGRSALVVFAQNSAVITLVGTVGTVLSSTMVAFSLARLRWPGRNFVFVLVLGTMMLPGVVTLVPTFIIFKNLGWVDTFLPLIVPGWLGGGGFSIFLMRQFLMTLPTELDEAARIDGASDLRILWQILMPLCTPVIAAVAIFAFLRYYDDFMGPLIYLNSNEKFPLSLGVRFFAGRYGDRWQLVMAVSALMLAPVVVIFFVAQRQFIRGIQMTGLAGR